MTLEKRNDSHASFNAFLFSSLDEIDVLHALVQEVKIQIETKKVEHLMKASDRVVNVSVPFSTQLSFLNDVVRIYPSMREIIFLGSYLSCILS